MGLVKIVDSDLQVSDLKNGHRCITNVILNLSWKEEIKEEIKEEMKGKNSSNER